MGVSGTIPLPFHTRVCIGERRVMKEIEPLVNAETVLVAHTPPLGTLDEATGLFHSGSRRLRDLVAIQQPRVMICGHVHERAGTAVIGKTVVVNCSLGRVGAGAMIELTGTRTPQVEMLTSTV